MANLPQKARVNWPDHLMHGAELPVHGWHHLDGQVHLAVTLPDGSRGYFPADKMALWDAVEQGDLPSLVLTVNAVARLRSLVEGLQGGSQRAKKSK